MSALADVRREARCTIAECAEAIRMSKSSYRRLEAGATLSGDPIGILMPLARLFSERLGRPISAQWHLCGAGKPSTGSPAPTPPLRLTTGGLARPRRAGSAAVSTIPGAVERVTAIQRR